MAKGKWDKRKIPESDKELRSLYMSPTTVKNMKGKAQNIKWEADHKAGKYGRKKSTYTYQQSSDKNPNIKGTRKQTYKDPVHDQKVSVSKAHKSRRTKGGGRETLRKTDVAESFGHDYGETSQGRKDYAAEGYVRELQDKSGKITKREYLGEKMKAKAKAQAEAKKKKTVKRKTTTYQGKKGDTIKPKVKESTAEYWRKSKKGPGYVPEKKQAKRKTDNTAEKQAKRETDSTVQKQIKSGFGDWASSDDFGKKMKSDYAKKKKSMLSGYGKKKKSMLSDYDKKKREMEASYAKKKKSMGG